MDSGEVILIKFPLIIVIGSILNGYGHITENGTIRRPSELLAIESLMTSEGWPAMARNGKI